MGKVAKVVLADGGADQVLVSLRDLEGLPFIVDACSDVELLRRRVKDSPSDTTAV